MTSYIVMEPPRSSGAEPGEEARFVRDGFSFLAFLVPLIWLLVHRLWLEAILVLAAAVAIGAAGEWAGLGAAAALLSLLVSLYVGLEGQAMRLAGLRRRGWREAAVVDARDRAEAEIAYFSGEWKERPVAPPPPVRTSPASGAERPSGPVLGLFGYPEA